MAASGRHASVLIASIRVAAPTFAIAALLLGARAYTQGDVTDPSKKNLPNPNPVITKNWGMLPDSRVWGSTAGVDIAPDGNVWAYDRCGKNTCVDSDLPSVFKFDRHTGKMLAGFGGGQIVFPHGIYADRDGSVWVTDGQANPAKTKGMQVFKFSPDGKVLMTLGKAGVGAIGQDTFNEPNDVVVGRNGDIFVADGHSGQNPDAAPGTNARIVKFDKNGKYIKEWGKLGSAPGEFRTPHALAIDSTGRLFVADRGNMRLQVFDQDGKFLTETKEFSRISGLFIDRSDMLYAIDSETNGMRHPGWSTGVRVGSTKDLKVTMFVAPHKTDNAWGAMGEGVAVDPDGNVYGAEGPISRPAAGGGLTKFSKR